MTASELFTLVAFSVTSLVIIIVGANIAEEMYHSHLNKNIED